MSKEDLVTIPAAAEDANQERGESIVKSAAASELPGEVRPNTYWQEPERIVSEHT